MTEEKKLAQCLALLAAIVELSDRVESCGGMACLSGIAAAAKMQKSIQKNKPRLVAFARELQNSSEDLGASRPDVTPF